MENQMSSEEIEKGKVLRQMETGKVRGTKLGWKRGGLGWRGRRLFRVRSNLLSSKFSPRINQQMQMPDLANVLQLFTVVRDSPATPFVPLVSTGPRSYCGRFKFSELPSQNTKKPSLSSFSGSRLPTLLPAGTFLFQTTPHPPVYLDFLVSESRRRWIHRTGTRVSRPLRQAKYRKARRERALRLPGAERQKLD